MRAFNFILFERHRSPMLIRFDLRGKPFEVIMFVYFSIFFFYLFHHMQI